MNVQNASFVLKTSDLIAYATNPDGDEKGKFNNAYHSSFTFKNVNIKAIIGTMWDDYDYFNLTLSSNVCSQLPVTNVFANATVNGIGVLYMSGLNWIGSGYDVSRNVNTSNACIGVVNYGSTITSTTANSIIVGVLIQYNLANTVTFAKGNPNTDITIFFNRVSDNTIAQTANNVFSPMQFLFKIVGVPKKEQSFSNHHNRSLDNRISL